MNARALLDWYALAGVDTAVADLPLPLWAPSAPPAACLSEPEPRPALEKGGGAIASDRATPAMPSQGIGAQEADRPTKPASPSLLVPQSRRVGDARSIAAACHSLEELEAALAKFEGCGLRETATRLCFADGNPQARLMLIGEAPGAEEDRRGKPFVGQSGQLLDRILAPIGIDRASAWITNVIYWRPPGNRPPTTGEIAVCLPFLERQIEILDPAFILFVGGIAAKALLNRSEGVTKLRGRPFTFTTAKGRAVPCLVTFHPAYLLRQPLNKRFVWRDMLQMRERLDELGVACG